MLPAIWGISHQCSVILSPCTPADHFLFLVCLQQQAPLCENQSQRWYLCAYRQEEKCVKMNIWYLPSDFPIWSRWWVLLPTHTHTQRFMHCVSSCSLLTLGCVKKKNLKSSFLSKRRKKNFSRPMNVCFYCTNSFSVFSCVLLCMSLCVLVCTVCMHACMVWVWRRLIKYSPILLLHNAVMFLHTELIVYKQAEFFTAFYLLLDCL